MNTTRWTLGAVLVAAISLWGLTEAGASPFSTWLLSDDLGNQVNGSAPEQGEWETEPGAGADDGSDPDSDGSAGSNNGHGNNEDGVDSSNPGGGNQDNNGHGNNEDGVDSSNPGEGQGGPNGGVDESCDGTGDCVDDEIGNGGGDANSESTTNNGKGKKK